MNAQILSLAETLLLRADSPLPGVAVVTADEVASWPAEALALFTEIGLLTVASPAQAVVCVGCFEEHVEPVELLDSFGAGNARFYIACPHVGRVSVDPERLRTWRVDLHKVAEAVAAGMDTDGAPSEIVPGRLWRLGRVPHGDRNSDAFLARGAGWDDAAAVIAGCPSIRQSQAPLLFTLVEAGLALRGTVLALSRALALAEGRLAFDSEAVVRATVDRAPSRVGQAPFHYTDDFRWIEVDGEGQSVSINRAMVLARLHELARPASEAEVLEAFAEEIRSKRFADVFKGSQLLGTFVIPLGGGLFRLKYY